MNEGYLDTVNINNGHTDLKCMFVMCFVDVLEDCMLGDVGGSWLQFQ